MAELIELPVRAPYPADAPTITDGPLAEMLIRQSQQRDEAAVQEDEADLAPVTRR